jgi:hypothetical protein
MKKIILSALLLSSITISAHSMATDESKKMYFNFGLGVGSASEWNQNSLALNAMTMGFYLKKNLGVEVGMDALPGGGNSSGKAMIMSYHLAAKGLLPLSDLFSLYGKAGLGVNAYEGEGPATGMMGMRMVNQASAGLYYAAGVHFNFNENFGLYAEGAGIAIPKIGNNGKTQNGSFGSTYQATLGLEVRL